MTKPSLPRGTRDFAPEVMAKRQYLLQAIRTTFERFGFAALETPALENYDVLTGKYGEEGDQLLFRVFNSGALRSLTDQDLTTKGKEAIQSLADRALRYDLTVPFARFVAMNRGMLTFPFKRYQIQPVWRGDNPQRGRYREFYQCDADVVGTDSLLCEAEIVLMINEVLGKLGVQDFQLKINHRKILTGIAQTIATVDKTADLCVAIDKLDKIGLEKVNAELYQRGFAADAVAALQPVLAYKGNLTEKMHFLAQFLQNSVEGQAGIAEMQQILHYLTPQYPINNIEEQLHLDFDLTLARGLSYYTGAIFEVKITGASVGSVSGGGRYANLTETFGVEGLSGVGFSFGVDRLYDALEELSLFPASIAQTTEVLVVGMDEESLLYGVGIAQSLRSAGLRVEVYPSVVKMKKSLGYADAKRIPCAVIIGENERQQGQVSLKDLGNGTQTLVNAYQLADEVKKLLK